MLLRHRVDPRVLAGTVSLPSPGMRAGFEFPLPVCGEREGGAGTDEQIGESIGLSQAPRHGIEHETEGNGKTSSPLLTLPQPKPPPCPPPLAGEGRGGGVSASQQSDRNRQQPISMRGG